MNAQNEEVFSSASHVLGMFDEDGNQTTPGPIFVDTDTVTDNDISEVERIYRDMMIEQVLRHPNGVGDEKDYPKLWSPCGTWSQHTQFCLEKWNHLMANLVAEYGMKLETLSLEWQLLLAQWLVHQTDDFDDIAWKKGYHPWIHTTPTPWENFEELQKSTDPREFQRNVRVGDLLTE